MLLSVIAKLLYNIEDAKIGCDNGSGVEYILHVDAH